MINVKKLGKWELDKIHNIDCLIGLKDIPESSVDIAITSPPYWGQRAGDGLGMEKDPREYINKLTLILLEVMRVLKKTGCLWLNLSDTYNTPINWRKSDYIYSTLGENKLKENNAAFIKDRGHRRAFVAKEEKWLQYGNLLAIPYRIILNLCTHGFFFRGEIIWVKGKTLPEGICRRPHRKHESIYLITKSLQHSFRTKPPVPSVWIIKAGHNQSVHTSTFPEELPQQCIQATGIKSGIVLDPFMGSGTTALAAQKLGLNFIGFEINPQYTNIVSAHISDIQS